MSRESGQSLIEAIVAFPVCVICAMTIVDGGLLVRDRIAVTQAATRAAEAHRAGRDSTHAARAALPAGLASSVQVEVVRDRLTVTATGNRRFASVAGMSVTQSSTVQLAAREVRR